jgi:hypothetical protein
MAAVEVYRTPAERFNVLQEDAGEEIGTLIADWLSRT